MGLSVFLSHSHLDHQLAQALCTFLSFGAGIEMRKIRCTSHAATGLASGDQVAKQLRKDIAHTEFFLPLITANSAGSEFMAFEIGAAWALKKRIVTLVYMPAKGGVKLPSLLAEFHYRDISKQDQLVALAQDIATEMWVRRDQPNAVEMLTATTSFLSQVTLGASPSLPSKGSSKAKSRNQKR
ncbi:MAG: toll/interleukin-1 receptor domain-containing protein [Chthoniobacter sp.]|uniref:toll/interleukin-1 receptor domain-containing protein n=1 Tax=Chthoniobacter sp. TaxID=2510640 RepID=UPI0032A73ABA